MPDRRSVGQTDGLRPTDAASRVPHRRDSHRDRTCAILRRGHAWLYRPAISPTLRSRRPFRPAPSPTRSSAPDDPWAPASTGSREANQISVRPARSGEPLRKKAALEARERARELASSSRSRGAHPAAEIINLEQSLADKTRTLGNRLRHDRPDREIFTVVNRPRAIEHARRDRRRQTSTSSRNAGASFSTSPADRRRGQGTTPSSARGGVRRSAATSSSVSNQARETAATTLKIIATPSSAAPPSTPSRPPSRRRPAERRHEGTNHRARGPEHPGPPDGDRRQPHRRRHARRHRPLQLQSLPPRGGAAGNRTPHRRRTHPSRSRRSSKK